MPADTVLTLGDFQFTSVEIPPQIDGLGVSQSLAVHRLIGGNRVIDAMGQDFKPITWSGLFFGNTALDRMNALKALAAAGLPHTLAWHTFSYLVIIREFSADQRRQFEIPYSISCEVVQDNISPVASSGATIDASLGADLGIAQQIADRLQAQATAANALLIEQIESTIAAITTVMAGISTFASAPPSVIASVLQPLGLAQGYVATLLDVTDTTLGAVGGFAGVVAGSDALSMAQSLLDTQSAALAECQLLELGSILGRMAANLNSVNGSPNTLAIAGGNLFAIAAAEYGDANDWTAIATANGLTDPFLTGTTVLTIPLAPADNGGILSN